MKRRLSVETFQNLHMAQILLLFIETKKILLSFIFFKFLEKNSLFNSLSNRRRPFQVHCFRKWEYSCHKNLQNKIQIVSQLRRRILLQLPKQGLSTSSTDSSLKIQKQNYKFLYAFRKMKKVIHDFGYVFLG